MSKEQLIADCKAKLQAAQDQALGELVDAAQAEVQPAPSGGFSQADIDAAVQAAKDADQKAMEDALSQAHAEADAAKAAYQAQIDALAAAKAVDDKVISDFQASQDKLQSVLDQLKALMPQPQA